VTLWSAALEVTATIVAGELAFQRD
jgi:hypothetical protein